MQDNARKRRRLARMNSHVKSRNSPTLGRPKNRRKWAAWRAARDASILTARKVARR